jgi:hypothetical protein
METSGNGTKQFTDRRKFLKSGMLAAGAAIAGGGMLAGKSAAYELSPNLSAPITRGDIAILQFLNALEQIEADLWLQYSELGGTQDSEVSGFNGGNPLYTAAVNILDGDMAQYIHDNTDDELTHASFLTNYLESKGARSINLDRYRDLPSSQADGANKTLGRLTNLTQLTIDTSFWARYRSITNPETDPGATFVQAVPSLNVGRHTAIPRTNDDTAGSTLSDDNTKSITPHLQAIAFTAGFHFASVEVGGTSLYPTLAQQVSNLEVLRVLLAIGPSEAMHFQTWQDKAGNALPLTSTDRGFRGSTGSSVTFPDLQTAQGETDPESVRGNTLQANLIMPEPTHFLDRRLGPVSIVRPTSSRNSGAVATVLGFVQSGLFIGQRPFNRPELISLLLGLAEAADRASRGF